MKRTKNCKYCYEPFESKRSNHVYCTASCKTKASYKRNDYKYVSGHYKKSETSLGITEDLMPTTSEILDSIKSLETKMENIKPTPEVNIAGVANAAIGTASANAAVFIAKKVFAPNTLPATKGDVEDLKREIESLKFMIKMKSR